MSKNLSDLAGKKGLEDNLFEQVGRLATVTGTPAKKDLARLADEFLMGKANLYGTASFYDFTKEDNRGKKIYICNGSACLTARTQDEVREKISAHFQPEEVGHMCCLGRCYENSSFHYQGINYSGDDINALEEIIEHPTPRSKPFHYGAVGSEVLIHQDFHVPYFAEILEKVLHSPDEFCLEELRISGLRGRGGAGFPIAVKFDACKKSPGKHKFLVCNADEGDPGAFSDRFLMEKNPYSILFGMVMGGFMTGADYGVVYIRGEYPESIRIIGDAIKYMHENNFCGDKILGTDFSFNFKLISAMGAYICGEETALLNSIEGQRPEVRVRPPYPAVQGLFNMPTVVNNVETLACIPWIMKNGGQAFAGVGRGKSTGTKLISLDGFFNRPGIYEVDNGTPLRKVVDELGGGFRVPIKALHIGGPLGGLLPIEKIDALSIDFESFAEQGFLLGHGSILCIPEDFPMIEYVEHLFEFTAQESCGKCFPCRLGATRGQELMHKARTGDYKIESGLLEDLLETMQLGSLCALGGGVPLPVKNALEYFSEEMAPYLSK
ncbi:MAG TPA: NADH-ubiquinone oxidoreductase-F iron-sulfur binding region domain-containing protein [Saprospiraceae bacterium]|nr:NADH-ubiquinone oxidoreductase-F iron-sulfur binding region domain-containing protein [Saprospiraceae bacterium]HQW55851.1 NADH-ubiquinone oxidoreductase-F iron-sulfur binding region domain-containing protein [Saprospiraceae bacterium]